MRLGRGVHKYVENAQDAFGVLDTIMLRKLNWENVASSVRLRCIQDTFCVTRTQAST